MISIVKSAIQAKLNKPNGESRRQKINKTKTTKTHAHKRKEKKMVTKNLPSQIQPVESYSLPYLCAEPRNDFASIQVCKAQSVPDLPSDLCKYKCDQALVSTLHIHKHSLAR